MSESSFIPVDYLANELQGPSYCISSISELSGMRNHASFFLCSVIQTQVLILV